jgi:short-subunit dehydrogenase
MPPVAIITGASSGIGWALAKELSREGYAVGLTARRSERLAALAGEIEAAGGRAAYASADAGDRSATHVALAELTAALGPVDLLVANAGLGISEPLLTPNADDYERMIGVNLLGPYYAFEFVAPEMRSRGQGHLVAVSSLAAYITAAGSGQYSATKAGLSMWMESIRLELHPHGIAVTTIQPGFIETPMTEVNDFAMPLLMSADKAARLMARAIRRKKKVYNFPWRMGVAARVFARLPDWIRRRFS